MWLAHSVDSTADKADRADKSDNAEKGQTRAVPTTPGATPSTGKANAPGPGPAQGKGDFSEDSTTPVTFPDGRPAPTGVTQVLRQDGTISLSFAIAADRLGDKPQTLVPPLRTRVSEDGSSITVWVGCARASRESLAQVSVSETDRIVTVAAVVIVPAADWMRPLGQAAGTGNSA